MEGIATLSVPELTSMLESRPETVICDANGDSVRESYGVIPGARLLTSASAYDIASELPAGKQQPLVFYCSSKMCSAAPSAARRALDAGYTDVYVLPEGIKGWVQAGRPVAKPRG
jgi:rhodanese-related sulfurtransferase